MISSLEITKVEEPKYKFREEWLHELVKILRPRLSNLGYQVPEKLQITCGFPSKLVLSKKKRRIGEAWRHEASKDGTVQVLISPVLDDPLTVAETVVHELGHATGIHNHKGDFRDFMKKLGLTGKPTATYAGEELRLYLAGVVGKLGAYPHSALTALSAELQEKKQTTRMLKATCVNTEEHAEPYIVRLSRKALAIGVPSCPCGREMVAEESENDSSEGE